MKGQRTGAGVRGALYLQHWSWVMNLSNLLLLAVSGNKMLLFGTPERVLGPEVGNKATYNYVLKLGTNFFDWFGKESEQEQLSVLAALVDYRAAIAPSFLPPVWFLLLKFCVVGEKKCHNYLLCLSAVLTTLKTRRKRSEKVIWSFWISLAVGNSGVSEPCLELVLWWRMQLVEVIGETQKAPYYIELMLVHFSSQTDIPLAQILLIFNMVKRG